MKSSHKKSNKMLMGAGIFLVVYLLFSIIFGTAFVSSHRNEIQRRPAVTVWRNW